MNAQHFPSVPTTSTTASPTRRDITMAATTATPHTPPHEIDLTTLSLEETAAILRHSLRTARNLRNAGGHPVYNDLAIKEGNRVLFLRADVYAYLVSQRGKEV